MIAKAASLRTKAIWFASFFFLILLGGVGILSELATRVDRMENSQQFLAELRQIHTESYFDIISAQDLDNKEFTSEQLSHLKSMEEGIQWLQTGGKLPQSEQFLAALPTLPAITWDRMAKSWQEYSIEAHEYLKVDPVPVPADTTVTATASDSTQTAAPAVESAPMVKTPSVTPATLEASHKHLLTWMERLETDLQHTADSRRLQFSVALWILLALQGGYLILGFFQFRRHILSPIDSITGELVKNQQAKTVEVSEFGTLTQVINGKMAQLEAATAFVREIGKGNLEIDYRQQFDADYQAGHNELADSLIAMQEQLKVLNETEKARKWASEGLSKFVDILRNDQDNLTALGDKVISALTQYTGSNQGGLYLLNDDDPQHPRLELLSLFAFNAKKFEQQSLRLGEGILGQAFLERQTTLLTEIPESYIRITSGLGDAPPNSILIVPLKMDREVYGLVELASFRTFQPYEIEFVEKLGENIASTLASAKTTARNRLLIEQFQEQTEEMKAQEEEMRQNMEELLATQEEMARKERDYIQKIETLQEKLANSTSLEEWKHRQETWENQRRNLEEQLKQSTARPDDWELAEEMERTFRTQLELLRSSKE